MIIHSYENSLRAQACIEYLNGINGLEAWDNIILLPIPSTRDKLTISNTKVDIYSLISQINDKTFVSGYGLPEELVAGIRARGGRVVDLEGEEDFLLENAELTALATLGIFLGSTKVSPKDSVIGVVGYGRIGRRLVNMLMYLGAGVKVFTSRANTRLDLCEYGVASTLSSVDADLRGLDLLVNTAPARIFAPESVPEGLRIIDLASGDNFPGIGVEKYPSVPAKMFPYSAGRVWGRTLEKYLVNYP
jgi:hypothetical protein